MSDPNKKIVSFDDFLKLIKDLEIKVIEGDPALHNGQFRSKNEIKQAPKTPYIYVEWSTGGVSGGSCYDETGDVVHHSYTNSDPPPELVDLDTILEKLSPTITFLQYKKIYSDVVEYSSRKENEYYGNSTNYSMKKCSLEKLYNILIVKGIL